MRLSISFILAQAVAVFATNCGNYKTSFSQGEHCGYGAPYCCSPASSSLFPVSRHCEYALDASGNTVQPQCESGQGSIQCC
ncbi:unnamed protein product [Diplocarpon coronariae]